MAGINYVNLFGAPAQQAPQATVIPVQRIAAQAPLTPAAGALQGLSSAAGSIIAALSGRRKDQANQAVMDALMQSQKGWTAPDDIYQGSHRTPEQIAADPQTQAMLSGVPAALAQASGQPQQITADPGQQMAMAQGQPGVPQSAPITPVQVQPLTGASGNDTLVPSPNDLAEDPEGTMGRFRRNMAAFETRDIGKMNPLQETRPGQMVAQAMAEPKPAARTSYLSPPQRGAKVASAGEPAPGTQGVPAALASLRHTAQQNPELASYLQGPMQNMQLMQMQQQEDARLREQALQDKLREPTGDVRTLYQMGIDPQSPEGQRLLRQGFERGTRVQIGDVNTGPSAEKYNEAEGKRLSEQFGKYQDAADNAYSQMSQIDLMRSINDEAGAGALAPFTTSLKEFGVSVLGPERFESLGLGRDNVAVSTLLDRMSREMALGKHAGIGGVMTDKDFNEYMRMVPGLADTREGRALALEWMGATQQRIMDKADMAYEFRDENGLFDERGFRRAWRQHINETPLISSERMEEMRRVAQRAPESRPAQAGTLDPAAMQRQREGQGAADIPPIVFNRPDAAASWLGQQDPKWLETLDPQTMQRILDQVERANGNR